MPWAAPARAAQTLLIAAVAAGLVWVLPRVSVVVVELLVALILAAAVAPAVKWLELRGWSNLLATLAAFVGILVVVGGILAGIVFSVRSEWGTLTAQAVEGWDELQRFITTGPLPLDTVAIDRALRQVGQFLSSGAVASQTTSGISAATQVITGAVLVVVILFFFLKDGTKMWNFILRSTRGERRAKMAESIARGSEVLGGYVRGTDAIALTVGTLVGGIFGAILAVPYTAVSWAVIQIWATGYQAGADPVLGKDPLDPKDRIEAKATVAQRFKYQRMGLQRRGGAKLGATEQDATGEDPRQTAEPHPSRIPGRRHGFAGCSGRTRNPVDVAGPLGPRPGTVSRPWRPGHRCTPSPPIRGAPEHGGARHALLVLDLVRRRRLRHRLVGGPLDAGGQEHGGRAQALGTTAGFAPTFALSLAWGLN
jgi:predicted PurR-regulated permease PerM